MRRIRRGVVDGGRYGEYGIDGERRKSNETREEEDKRETIYWKITFTS